MKRKKLGSVAGKPQYRIDLEGPILFPRMIIKAIREWRFDICLIPNKGKWNASTEMLERIIQYAYKHGNYNELFDFDIIEYDVDKHEWFGVPNVIGQYGSVRTFIDGFDFEVYPWIPPSFMDAPLEYWLDRVMAKSYATFSYKKSDRDYDIVDEPYDFKDDK